jgi:hypothetical protein
MSLKMLRYYLHPLYTLLYPPPSHPITLLYCDRAQGFAFSPDVSDSVAIQNPWGRFALSQYEG